MALWLGGWLFAKRERRRKNLTARPQRIALSQLFFVLWGLEGERRVVVS